MTTSFLYQAFGIREQECTRVRYEDNSIILEIQTRKDKLVCPQCKSRHINRSGSHIRRIRNVSMEGFWKKVNKNGVVIKAVATDLSGAFISSVLQNAPQATLVFDHFHVVKLMNDTLDIIRRNVYREEKDLNKRKVLKGTRWLLLCNGKDIFDDRYKSGRLENALALNEPLMKAYYLKESLKEIWMQIDEEQAGKVLDDWVEQAYQAKIPQLTKFANTLKAHRWGILAWYKYHISTGKLEGINNKIKTMKRQAYGYRDQKFFELKILAMHDKNYAFVG